MRTPTYEEFLANPDAILAAVEQAAHRERAEAVQALLVAPLKRMWERITQQPAHRLKTQSA